MFILKAVSEVFSDCTRHFDVELDKTYTVAEFVKTVLTENPNEWGYIGFKTREGGFVSDYYPFGSLRCEYRNGVVTTDFPFDAVYRTNALRNSVRSKDPGSIQVVTVEPGASIRYGEEIMSREVRSVKASGGWTRMDYVLDIGEID